MDAEIQRGRLTRGPGNSRFRKCKGERDCDGKKELAVTAEMSSHKVQEVETITYLPPAMVTLHRGGEEAADFLHSFWGRRRLPPTP